MNPSTHPYATPENGTSPSPSPGPELPGADSPEIIRQSPAPPHRRGFRKDYAPAEPKSPRSMFAVVLVEWEVEDGSSQDPDGGEKLTVRSWTVGATPAFALMGWRRAHRGVAPTSTSVACEGIKKAAPYEGRGNGKGRFVTRNDPSYGERRRLGPRVEPKPTLEPGALCACGRPAVHGGRCSFRRTQEKIRMSCKPVSDGAKVVENGQIAQIA